MNRTKFKLLVPVLLIAADIHRDFCAKVTLNLSTNPFAWGLYPVVKILSVFIRKQNSRKRLERNLDPRSDKSTRGAPWQLTISFTKISATVLASIFGMAKVSVHFVHISMKTNI